jgi:hypothetical protein
LGYGDIVPVRWFRTLVAAFMFTYAQGRLNAAVGNTIYEEDRYHDSISIGT